MNDQQLRNILTHRTIGSERLQRNAAILLPLVTVDGRDALLFEVRSKRLEMQPGEICFPGGRIESGETPERAALRELWEELRIPSWQVTLLVGILLAAAVIGFLEARLRPMVVTACKPSSSNSVPTKIYAPAPKM